MELVIGNPKSQVRSTSLYALGDTAKADGALVKNAKNAKKDILESFIPVQK
jgi:hypothetical protein